MAQHSQIPPCPDNWWYASTAFPLLAGTFGPIANAFSICALSGNWKPNTTSDITHKFHNDTKEPQGLRALNGVSLIFALIANVSLFLNMAGRVTFNITQPITIAGFWIASILLIALVALVAHESHEKGVSSSSKTQAYYYCIIAAGIYQIISYAMCITLYGAYKGHYRKEFRLEKHQRALMLQTVVFLSYLLLGALIYSKLEGWEFLDAVYWADFTLLTIGIGGEFSPSTHEGRSLLFPFAFGGIVALGLIVESINNLGLDKTRRKLTRERIEKRRQRASKGTLVFRNMSKVKGQKIKTDSPTRATVCAPGIASRDGNESSRHEAEFDAIRRMQSFKTQRLEWIRLAISVFVVAILWFLGALVFWATEKTQDWSYFEALYFSYTTLMTIGYGDFQPETESSKPFFVFWTMLAVPTLTILVSHLRGTLFKGFKDLAIWIYRILTASTGYLQSFACSRFLTALESVPMGVQNCVRTENGQISHLEAIDSTVNDVEKSGETGQQQRGRHIHPTAENDHHYRYLLVSQINTLYRDLQDSADKRYSFAEWNFFLDLLGRDQAHKTPEHSSTGQSGSKLDVASWSWIENPNPLIEDENEPTWLLRMMLRKLEEDLLLEWRQRAPEEDKEISPEKVR